MGQDKVFSKKLTLNLGGDLIDLENAKVMGILNITGDSFYSVSRTPSVSEALKKAENMLAEGATFIDVGGQSTRPGSIKLTVQEEIDRALPVIKNLATEFPKAYISIDTYYSEVAVRALDAGACMVNDISGGTMDVEMFRLIAERKVPYVLMHMRGTPQNMNTKTQYENLIQDIILDLQIKIEQLKDVGVIDIIGDPGFGFAKTAEQNYKILDNLEFFDILRVPILVGLSRKSMIFKTLETSPEDAITGTIVLNTIALMKSANILRVHDVKQAVEAIKLVNKLNDSRV